METFSISSASIGEDIRAKILYFKCRNGDFHELFTNFLISRNQATNSTNQRPGRTNLQAKFRVQTLHISSKNSQNSSSFHSPSRHWAAKWQSVHQYPMS